MGLFKCLTGFSQSTGFSQLGTLCIGKNTFFQPASESDFDFRAAGGRKMNEAREGLKLIDC